MSIFFSGEVNEMGRRQLKPWISSVAVFFIFALGIFIFIGNPLIDKYREANPVDRQCMIQSAEVSDSRSATRGLSTSSTKLKIHTADCGTVYVSKVLSPSPAGSWQEMADELNRFQGQDVTLVFPPFQFPAEGDYALGYGYRL